MDAGLAAVVAAGISGLIAIISAWTAQREARSGDFHKGVNTRRTELYVEMLRATRTSEYTPDLEARAEIFASQRVYAAWREAATRNGEAAWVADLTRRMRTEVRSYRPWESRIRRILFCGMVLALFFVPAACNSILPFFSVVP
ncbi:hypothetical protein GCM10009850_047810 [Nonomuraea monospora]|uniref:SMODS and SLOG-associating 2TM effector domain-containing protein n=1 Tax=Nonomuraea monospora TaxID=568818 RepID=A0ABN3CJW3_9ACTN